MQFLNNPMDLILFLGSLSDEPVFYNIKMITPLSSRMKVVSKILKCLYIFYFTIFINLFLTKICIFSLKLHGHDAINPLFMIYLISEILFLILDLSITARLFEKVNSPYRNLKSISTLLISFKTVIIFIHMVLFKSVYDNQFSKNFYVLRLVITWINLLDLAVLNDIGRLGCLIVVILFFILILFSFIKVVIDFEQAGHLNRNAKI